jgi:hypothetical protein
VTFAAAALVVDSATREERVAFYVTMLRDRSHLAEELAYCASRAIPHSQFLAWSDDDQDKALAWQRVQMLACPHCGTFDDQWVDEQGRRIDPPPFEPVAHMCHGCADKAAFADDLREDRSSMNGITVRLRPFFADDDEDGD